MAEDVSIMQEIDDAMRVERMQQFWARHSVTIIACCVLLVLFTAVSVAWKSHLRETHARQTGELQRAVTLAQAGKFNEAVAGYTKAEEAGGPLAALAGLWHAQALASLKQEDKAIAAYNSVAGDTGKDAQAFADFARLQADIMAHNQALQKGKPLPYAGGAGGGIFAASRTEADALRALASPADAKSAYASLNSIVANENAAFSARLRAALLMDSLKEPKK